MSYFWSIITLIFLIISFLMLLGVVNPRIFNQKLKEHEKPLTRTQASVLLLFFGIISFITFNESSLSHKSTQTASPVASPESTSTASPKSTEKAKTTEDPSVKKAAEDKAKVGADKISEITNKVNETKIIIDNFNFIIDRFNDVLNVFTKITGGLSDGSVDQVTAYSDLKQLKDIASKVTSDSYDLDVPKRYSDARDILSYSCNRLESSIKGLQKYLDDQKVSTISSATDDLNLASQGIQEVTIKVATLAVNDGYTPPSPSPK